MSWSYLIALSVDCIGIFAALYFVIGDGIKYNRISSNSILPLLTLIFSAWVGISFYLYHHNHPTLGSIMAWIPAIPLLGYGLFVLMFIIFKPNMR